MPTSRRNRRAGACPRRRKGALSVTAFGRASSPKGGAKKKRRCATTPHPPLRGTFPSRGRLFPALSVTAFGRASLRPALPQCRSQAGFAFGLPTARLRKLRPACICHWQRRGAIPPEGEPRNKEKAPSVVMHRGSFAMLWGFYDWSALYLTISATRRWISAATSARVASPVGFRVPSPLPWNRPTLTAQAMSSFAQLLT